MKEQADKKHHEAWSASGDIEHGQHKAIILSSARWSALGNYIIFSAMVSIRQLYYLQHDGQHTAIILLSSARWTA